MNPARAALVCVALATAVGGCGGASADEVLEQTTANLAKIRSAELGLRLVLEPSEASRRGRVGFELRGPIQLRPGGLPVARLDYTQLAGNQQARATFLSTGSETFVEVAGTPYRLPKQQATSLAEGAGAVGDGTTLPLGRWLQDPTVDDGGKIDGTATNRVSAKLDVATALRDIFAAAAAAGADVPDLAGARSDELREAITASSIVVWSGREDHYLRRLRLSLSFEVTPPRALQQQLGDLVGGRLGFDIDLTRINKTVRVERPIDPRPATQLGASGD